jgi:IclR family acetate operon transcriptional repressor
VAYARNNSVVKSFRILEALNAADFALSASELASLTAIPLATTHRFLKNLAAMGYVAFDDVQKRYSVGFAATLFGNRRLLIERIVRRSRVHLRELSRETGLVAYLGSLEGLQVVVEDVAIPPGVERARHACGERIDAHAHSLGKALLAQAPTRDVKASLAAGPLRRHTRRTLLHSEQLLRDLADVRVRGFAMEDGEYEAGFRSIAKAMINPKGRSLCAVSVEVPAVSRDLKSLEAYNGILTEVAERILKPIN